MKVSDLTSYPLQLFAFIDCVCLTFSDCSQRAAFRDQNKKQKNNEMAQALWNGYTSVHLPSDSTGAHLRQSWKSLVCSGIVCQPGHTNSGLNGSDVRYYTVIVEQIDVWMVAWNCFQSLLLLTFIVHTEEREREWGKGQRRGSSTAASACPKHRPRAGFKGENEMKYAVIVLVH